jgi:hypothetical protein
VRGAAFEKGEARLTLDTVGLPKAGGREPRCKRLPPAVQLTLTGFPPAADGASVTARVDDVIPTPDAYLRAKGTAFDRAPGGPPAEVASELADASGDERRLAREVETWPRPLLSVDPVYLDTSGRVRYEGLVELEAVVGTDGRLYRPQLKTPLGPAHETAVLGALPFWRFEPARRRDKAAAGARVPLRLVFHINKKQ